MTVNWKILFQRQSEYPLNQFLPIKSYIHFTFMNKIHRFDFCFRFGFCVFLWPLRRAVIEHLVEKQFPAPSRRFVDGKASKTAKKRKIESPSRVEGRSSGSMRKSTDSGVGRHLRKPAKKSRVIVISSDSDESDSEKKKMDVTDSDDDNDVVKGRFLCFFAFFENF